MEEEILCREIDEDREEGWFGIAVTWEGDGVDRSPRWVELRAEEKEGRRVARRRRTSSIKFGQEIMHQRRILGVGA